MPPARDLDRERQELLDLSSGSLPDAFAKAEALIEAITAADVVYRATSSTVGTGDAHS